MGSDPHHMALTIGPPRTVAWVDGAGADVGATAARPVSFGEGGPLGKSGAEAAVLVGASRRVDRLEEHGRWLLSGAWEAVAPASVAVPPESMRRGPGPRAGLVAIGPPAGLWWSTSISHAAAGPVVAAAVAIQRIDRSAGDPRITIGVDVEPVHRFVHPGVARMIAARAVAEAAPVLSGAVPLLAVSCVKEAIYKADRRQGGRELADYAWIEARRTGDAGWCGVAIAGGDPTQRFSIGVICAEDSWLAVALGNC